MRQEELSDPTQRVKARARELGFHVVGVARADEAIGVEHARYRAFIDEGRHGQMGYLAEHVEARRRLDEDSVLSGAKSVICVGHRYARRPSDEAADPPLAQAIARYARGQDYHNHLRKKLRKLASFVRTLGPGVEARPICDIEPVMERVWAARAGLGFVGKHGLVITPGQGSYQILGEVVTTLALVADEPITERCGSCTRCLDACPTDAFTAPFVLDPRRCISYWTIEAEGAAPEPLRDAVAQHLFGCDLCQEACPFNRTAAAPLAETARFHPLQRFDGLGLEALVRLAPSDEDGFTALTEGSPLKRSRPEGLARNAAMLAAARLGEGTCDPAERLDAERALAAAARHDDAAVREIAAWAVQRTRSRGER
jgi:epoxyqueuosine reductase